MSEELSHTLYVNIFDETNGERMGRGRGGGFRSYKADKAEALKEAYALWQRWPECQCYVLWFGTESQPREHLTGDTLKARLKDYL